MTREQSNLRLELAGIDSLLSQFEQEQTLNDRIHTLSQAVVCLLNAAGRSTSAELARIRNEENTDDA